MESDKFQLKATLKVCVVIIYKLRINTYFEDKV